MQYREALWGTMELHPWWHPASLLESCLLDLTVSYMVVNANKDTHFHVLDYERRLCLYYEGLFCVFQAAVAVHAVLRPVRSVLQNWESQRGSYWKCNLLRHLPPHLHFPAYLHSCSSQVAALVVSARVCASMCLMLHRGATLTLSRLAPCLCRYYLMQERPSDHWNHGCQHMGPLPSRAPARLRSGGDTALLLALFCTQLPAGQELFQGSKNGNRKMWGWGETCRCYGGEYMCARF